MRPTRAQETAFLRSVIYASLFDYPLTLAQLHTSLVGVRADEPSVAAWWRDSPLLQATVEHRDGLYFPAGRGDLLETRARREAVSRDLLERQQRVVALVARMPFVRMVALSGSLAHLNAERSADLDLFVITSPGRVWAVTLTLLVIARLMGWRRQLCLNYVISERAMAIEPADLFSANQIIHLRPITGHDVFARFVDANPFVQMWYPNFTTGECPPARSTRVAALVEPLLSLGVAQVSERVARAVYRRHLLKRSNTWVSRDQVRLEAECLKLHTTSHRAATMAQFDDEVARALETANTKDTKNTKETLFKILA